MFPRFRIMAVSMEHLQISVARISAITIDVIHFDPVVMLEEQSTITTTTVLRFEQLGQSRTGTRVPSLSDTPVHPIAIVRATVSLNLDMPCDCHLTMRVKVGGVLARGRRGKGTTGADPMPVSVDDPSGGFRGVPSMCPVAEFNPGQIVQSCIGHLTHPNAIVIRPAPDFGIELIDQRALG
jgi:hypothetical protein